MVKLTNVFRKPAEAVHRRLPQCPSRARTKDVSQEGALCNTFPAHIEHPAVAIFGAGAGRFDHRPDQQVADENSVRSQSHREVVQEIAQQSSSRRSYPGCVVWL